MADPMRVCIAGAWYSSRNAGDQAILVATRRLLEDRVESTKLCVICEKDEFVRDAHGLNAVSQFTNLPGVYAELARSDAFLIGGGTPFYDDFRHMLFFLSMALATRVTGGKVIVYGASAQALKRPIIRFLARCILNLSALVTVREQETADLFRSIAPGVTTHVFCDPAISLQPCSPTRVNEMLSSYPFDRSKPLFALCPHYFSNTDAHRVHHYEAFSDDAIEGQAKAFAALVTKLVERGTVFLVPMNVDDPDSDMPTINEVYSAIEESKRSSVVKVEEQFKPDEIVGLFERCRLVVGTRLHSLVLSGAARTPFVGVDYAPKVRGFVKILSQEDATLPLDGLSSSELGHVVEDLLDHYDERRVTFRRAVDRACVLAGKNVDAVVSAIRGERLSCDGTY